MSSLVAASSNPTKGSSLKSLSFSPLRRSNPSRNNRNGEIAIAIPETSASSISSVSGSIEETERTSTTATACKQGSEEELKLPSIKAKKPCDVSLFDAFDLSRLKNQMELLMDRLHQQGGVVVVKGMEPDMMQKKTVNEGRIGSVKGRSACCDQGTCYDGDFVSSSLKSVPNKVNVKNGRIYHGSLDHYNVSSNEPDSQEWWEYSAVWSPSMGVKKGVGKSLSALHKFLQRMSKAVKRSAHSKQEGPDHCRHYHHHHHHYHHHNYGKERDPVEVYRTVRRRHYSESPATTGYPSMRKSHEGKGQEGVTTWGLPSLSAQAAAMLPPRRNTISRSSSLSHAKEESRVWRPMTNSK